MSAQVGQKCCASNEREIQKQTQKTVKQKQ